MIAALLEWLSNRRPENIADLRYVGDIYTEPTIRALQSLLQEGFRPSDARILSVISSAEQGSHVLVVDGEDGRSVVLRDGLTSGYLGEGPAGLSWAIELLEEFDCYPRVVEVPREILQRARHCALTYADLDLIGSLTADREHALRLFDAGRRKRPSVWHGCPSPLPFALIDPRLLPIAVSFRKDPDRAIFEGYRRLEHVLRTRLRKSSPVGAGFDRAKIGETAFAGDGAPLRWPGLSKQQTAHRFTMIDTSFALSRNPRAHAEDYASGAVFEEFMTLNMLFRFEAEAEESRAIG